MVGGIGIAKWHPLRKKRADEVSGALGDDLWKAGVAVHDRAREWTLPQCASVCHALPQCAGFAVTQGKPVWHIPPRVQVAQHGGVVCDAVQEQWPQKTTMRLVCPEDYGGTITGVLFASFGGKIDALAGNGMCDHASAQHSPCHFSQTKLEVEKLCTGKATCEIPFDAFPDPCPGKIKWLSVAVTCGQRGYKVPEPVAKSARQEVWDAQKWDRDLSCRYLMAPEAGGTDQFPPLSGENSMEVCANQRVAEGRMEAKCKPIRDAVQWHSGTPPSVPRRTCSDVRQASEWSICWPPVQSAIDSGTCLVYSFGIAKSDAFTNYVAERGCTVFAFDPGVDHPLHPWKGVTFHRWGIASGAKGGQAEERKYVSSAYGETKHGRYFTLPEMITKLGHVGKTITIMKLDCEGCEWEAYKDLATMDVKVNQLLTELHFTAGLRFSWEQALKVREFTKFVTSNNLGIFHNSENKGFLHDRKVDDSFVACGMRQGSCCRELGLVVPITTAAPAVVEVPMNSGSMDYYLDGITAAPSGVGWIKDIAAMCPQDRHEGYSQGNQDCVLDYVFGKIGTTNKYFVEYGFNTKDQCSGSGPNTCKLWKVHGWKGLLLDGDNENLAINLRREFLYSDNIVGVLEKYNVPKSPDFISSDMDSHDLFVIQSILSKYSPRVVTTEYNSNWPIGWYMSQICPHMAPDLDSTHFEFRNCTWGTSASALQLVMEGAGYKLVAVAVRLDLVWVRADLLHGDVPPFKWFVPQMDLATHGGPHSQESHHPAQTDRHHLKWLVDVKALLARPSDIAGARTAAVQHIEQNIASSSKLPCFAPLKPVMPFPVGAKIEARYGGGKEWFPGKVTGVQLDGKVAITYDDGDKEAAVDLAYVRKDPDAEEEEDGEDEKSEE